MARPVDPRKKEDILKAAAETFVEKGYTRTRMSEIAERAGLANGTLYLYFTSKEVLARSLADNIYQDLSDLIVEQLEKAASLEEMMTVVRAAFAFTFERRDLVRLLNINLGSWQKPSEMPVRARFFQDLARLLEIKMKQKVIRTYNENVLAELLASQIVWVIEASQKTAEKSFKNYEETALTFMRNALNLQN